MGYACPVCGDPQADAGHLANHLAFTAITSGGDHEAWLDERVPEWGQMGEDELAGEVAGEAEETGYPQVFEASGVDDGGGTGSHGHVRDDHDHGVDAAAARARGAGELDAEARAILEEAREMTEEMRQSGDDGSESAASEDDPNDSEAGATDEDSSGAETE